jgi:hypothetical protein
VLLLRPVQLLRCDREIAYAYTGRVEDGVRNGSSGSANPEFADAFDREGVRAVRGYTVERLR